MKSFLLVMSFLICASAGAENCGLCVKVSNFAKAYEDDEKKAYEGFSRLISQADLSKDKKIRAKELDLIVKTTVTFLPTDDRQVLADYLSAYNDEYPADFKHALKGLTKEQREDLENRIKIAKEMIEKGEPEEKASEE